MAIVPIPSLPLADPPGPRRDAARNRELLLAAARRLIAEHGVAGVSMDHIAEEAGVGKGTVFRRFGSRAGLLQALLDADETALQRTFMFGAPPLGPGGPPRDRLLAYGRARIRLVTVHGDLLVGAEAAARDPYDAPPWRVSTMTVARLLTEAGCRGDAPLWAAMLMAPLGARWITHQLESGIDIGRIEAAWTDLADRALGA